MKTFTPLPDFPVNPKSSMFLGIDPLTGLPCWTGPRDSVGIVGPPGSGKTSGIITPGLLHWSGPAVVASTRGDVLKATGDHRRRLAEPLGGEVSVYDPMISESVGSIQWTPLDGCQNPSICYRRVAEMVTTAAASSGVEDSSHWADGAADILRPLMHIAALTGRPLSQVRRWLATQEMREPVELLKRQPGVSEAALLWADDLGGMSRIGERERGSFYSVAKRSIKAVAEPTILASTAVSDLDIDRFLATKSTLYIVSPTHIQDVLAPMIAGLVGAVTERAAELAAAQGGRLNDPLLMLLDEVANIAPIKNLSGLTSEYGGRGINTVWATQTLDRLRARYGTEEAAAILGASTAKLIFGGLSNDADLRNFSSWEGERRETQTTTYGGGDVPRDLAPVPAGGITDRADTNRQHSIGTIYRPTLPIEALRRVPPGEALLWYQSDPVLRVETRPAGLVPSYARLAGYTPQPSRAAS